MTGNVVLSTCLQNPQLTESDMVLAKALEARGFLVSSAPWNGPVGPWRESDMAIIRSTWDYIFHIEEFRGWLSAITDRGQVINAPDLIRWNLDKSYLLELQKQGVPMAKLEIVDSDPEQIIAAMDRLQIDRSIVKPLVSNSAHGLSIVDRKDPAGLGKAVKSIGDRVIVQEVIDEIRDQGELSLIFFGGEYSHSVLKIPSGGDLRVQIEHGGRNQVIEPDPSTIIHAAEILRLCPSPPIYARVDLVQTDVTTKLMELELIEPDLFFDLVPAGAELFADCVE